MVQWTQEGVTRFGKGWIELLPVLIGTAFLATKVVHLECGTSDHKPILILLAGIPKHLQKLWRFEQMWMEEEGCHEAIESTWLHDFRGTRHPDG